MELICTLIPEDLRLKCYAAHNLPKYISITKEVQNWGTLLVQWGGWGSVVLCYTAYTHPSLAHMLYVMAGATIIAAGFVLRHQDLDRVINFYQRRYGKQNRELYREWAVTFDDEGFRITCGMNYAAYQWQHVLQIVNDTDFIYFLTVTNRRYFVPKRVFASPDKAEEYYHLAKSFRDTAFGIWPPAPRPL